MFRCYLIVAEVLRELTEHAARSVAPQLAPRLVRRRDHDVAEADLPVVALEHQGAGLSLERVDRAARDPVHVAAVDDGLAVQDHREPPADEGDVKGLPLPGGLGGVEHGGAAAVEGAAAVLLGHLRGASEDRDLVAAPEAGPAGAV